MPILHQPSKHAYYTDPESMTETEHADDCVAENIIRKAKRGIPVNNLRSSPIQYGEDDLTLDAVTHRIRKQQAEEKLSEIAKTHEFTDEELKLMPDHVKKKFKLKVKTKTNDDQTTKKQPEPQPTSETKPDPTSSNLPK